MQELGFIGDIWVYYIVEHRRIWFPMKNERKKEAKRKTDDDTCLLDYWIRGTVIQGRRLVNLCIIIFKSLNAVWVMDRTTCAMRRSMALRYYLGTFQVEYYLAVKSCNSKGRCI